MKYTRGPWFFEVFQNKESDRVFPLGEKRWALASPHKNNAPILIAGVFGSVPTEGDAKLIAAAPELLESLKSVLSTQATGETAPIREARALLERLEKP